jgi:citrate synthase
MGGFSSALHRSWFYPETQSLFLITSQSQGIRFHGLSIPECRKLLPTAPGGKEILPESMLWLLLTGQVPTVEQTRELSRELAEKGELPKLIVDLVDGYVMFSSDVPGLN